MAKLNPSALREHYEMGLKLTEAERAITALLHCSKWFYARESDEMLKTLSCIRKLKGRFENAMFTDYPDLPDVPSFYIYYSDTPEQTAAALDMVKSRELANRESLFD